IHLIRIHMFSIQFDRAFQACARNELVHPIERTQKCGLTATRRTDQRCNTSRPDLYSHVIKSLMITVIKIDVADVDLHVHKRMITEKMLQICEHVGNRLRPITQKVHTVVTPEIADLWHLNRYCVEEGTYRRGRQRPRKVAQIQS